MNKHHAPLKRASIRQAFGIAGIGCAVLAGPTSDAAAAEVTTAKGVVYYDINQNGRRDKGEPGLPNIRVSNQREIVFTDGEGNWELPAGEDTIFFVIKPSGWTSPLSQNNLPQFYYLHKPAGSPKTKYPGVAPTGDLPESIDFPLRRQEEPERFQAIFFGDPQPTSQQQIDYIAHDVVEELIGTEAKFGVTLGDILFNNLSLFESMNRTVALIGVPWFNVIGNHDINFDSPSDALSDETFERVYGPAYYSFDYGQVHFIVLDNVDWKGAKPEGPGRYVGGLGEKQIEFVKNDLKSVPEEKLVVLMMHIPLNGVEDRGALYRLIEKRPYTLSISGHTHTQEHRFLGKEDGWQGRAPHHHIVNVTVSGTWWKGALDERGIPHATMRDGAPNGWSVITFDGQRATFDFRAAGRPASYQMNIMAPEEVAAAETGKTDVHVNVFAGSERSTVEMRVGWDGEWSQLKQVREKDPFYAAVRDREMAIKPAPPQLNAPEISTHLWKGKLPAALPAGTHTLFVRTRDLYGRYFHAKRVIRVR